MFNIEKVVEFIKNYGGTKYNSPDNIDLKEEDRSRFLHIKDLAYNSKREFDEYIINLVKNYFPDFEAVRMPNWQHSGNIFKYFWIEFKLKEYRNNPSSISIMINKDKEDVDLFVYIESNYSEVNKNKGDFSAHNKIIFKEIDEEKYFFEIYNDSNIVNMTKEEFVNDFEKNKNLRVCIKRLISKPYLNSNLAKIEDEIVESFDYLKDIYIDIVEDYNEVKDNSNITKAYFVGTNIDGENKLKEFIANGVWENGYTDKYIEEVKNISIGEYIVAKSSYTRKYGLSFENNDKPVTVMKINAIGRVVNNTGDGNNLKVDWKEVSSNKEWYFYVLRGTLHKVERGKDWKSDQLLKFVFEDEEQDIMKFIEYYNLYDRYGIDKDHLELSLKERRLNSIINALKELGNEGDFQNIYKLASKDNVFKEKNFNREQNIKIIKHIIRIHSSDSKQYNSKNKDIFYSVAGLGSGIWGIRKEYLEEEIINEGNEESLVQFEVDFNLPLNLGKLYFEDDSILKKQIATALKTGKSIIFIGPPGTGKSKLAKEVAKSYKVDYKMVTAMSDWSSYDTIGGYKPTEKGNLYFEEGIFLNVFKDKGNNANKWLIIDEINRADIDKAFGPLFSALSGDNIELGLKTHNGENIEIVLENNEEELVNEISKYIVPKDWRIIGAMNTFDKTSLYEMSYAFMRRFAFIPVPIPKTIDGNIVSKYLDLWDIKLELQDMENISKLWKLINKYRRIGPAIIEDISKYISIEGDYESAIFLYILPQFEGMFESEIKKFLKEVEGLSFIKEKNRFINYVEDFFNMKIEEGKNESKNK